MDSNSIYSNGVVTVTRAMFRVGSTQFPIRNIASIQILYDDPDRGGPQLFIIVGFLFIVVPIWSFFRAGNNDYGLLIFALAGILMFVIGILWWRSQKKTYHIEVESGGSKSRAYSSTNHVEIIKINQAINSALEAH